MELIDKAAVMAIIEKRKQRIYPKRTDYTDGQKSELVNLSLEIDTLEVKEVDLEEELESFAYTLPHSAIGDGEHLGKFDDPKVKEARKHGWSHLWRYNYVKEIAKHFFELGLKSQNMITPLQQQRISVMKMEFWTGLQTFNESEMTLSDAYNKGIEDVLEELGLKVQKGEEL